MIHNGVQVLEFSYAEEMNEDDSCSIRAVCVCVLHLVQRAQVR